MLPVGTGEFFIQATPTSGSGRAFQQLWDYNSAHWAGKFLDEWCRQVMRFRIEPRKKIARSLRQHRELILNYFRARKMLSSGVAGGVGNMRAIVRDIKVQHWQIQKTLLPASAFNCIMAAQVGEPERLEIAGQEKLIGGCYADVD